MSLTSKTITFAPLSVEMIDQTAGMHIEYMPHDLASQIGLNAVRDLFHLGTIKYPGGIGFVALCEGQVIGFCLAQVDFRAFSLFQRRDILSFYGKVIPSLLRHPSLVLKILGAQRYLRGYSAFVNLGPLLVKQDFRNPVPLGDNLISVAGELARMTFAKIRQLNPSWSVLTMIRPNNLPSISAVAQGAYREDYKQFSKRSITFGSDVRIVYEYCYQPSGSSQTADRHANK